MTAEKMQKLVCVMIGIMWLGGFIWAMGAGGVADGTNAKKVNEASKILGICLFVLGSCGFVAFASLGGLGDGYVGLFSASQPEKAEQDRTANRIEYEPL